MKCGVSRALFFCALVAGSGCSPAPTSAPLTAQEQTNEPAKMSTSRGSEAMTSGSEEAAEATRHTAPTIINKLRDVSEPASHENNNAAEELDGDAGIPKLMGTRDENDADEHDDDEEKSDAYIDSKAPKMNGEIKSKVSPSKRASEVVLPATVIAVSEEDFHDWPESLPTPVAQTNGATGKQRSDGTYVITDSEEYPCVLASFKFKITIYYPAVAQGDAEKTKNVAMSPPDDATVSGTCDREAQVATLEITWKPGTFIIGFDFDTLTDSWYVSSFQFAFNSGNAYYVDSKTEKEMVVKSEEGKRFWMTSHARSFRCSLLHDIPLTADEGRFSGSIHFDEVRVQALTYGDRFKTPKHCMHRVQRDEKVPLIVGSTLAALSACTIGVYAAIRYYKIKKVQYDTMH